jgi:DNA-binding NarL/FixJ family response regulator
MAPNAIQVALVDDHKLFRKALRQLLSTDSSISILFEAEDGIELMTSLKSYFPDVILLDIQMPRCNGLEALKMLHEKYPEHKVIMLSQFLDEVYVAKCLEYGIYGYLTKTMDTADVIEAIKKSCRNEMYMTNLIGNQLIRNYLLSFKRKVDGILPEFTLEEIRILSLIREERSTEEISDIMNLSKRSIELKREKMKTKANAKTVGGLLVYALKRGLLTFDSNIVQS